VNESRSRYLVRIIESLIPLLETEMEEEWLALVRLLHQRLLNPQAYVTVVGETSTGKSSLVNALLGQPLLPVQARPTQATVVHVICYEGKMQFFAIYRDGTQEEISYDSFISLNKEVPKKLLRLQLRCSPPRRDAEGLNVFDTPGYNSIIAEHEQSLRELLPQSDVIIFVVGYRTGFNQADQELFEIVQELTSEDPDIPVILVVNRTPTGTVPSDCRVKKIMDNAIDCLKRKPELVIVPSFTAEKELSTSLPDAKLLWEKVLTIVNSPERNDAVLNKLENTLISLIDQADDTLELKAMILRANEKESVSISILMEHLKKAKKQSLDAIEKTFNRLRGQLPRLVKSLTEKMMKQIQNEIDSFNKWLGYEDCINFLHIHLLPFECRKVCKGLEDYIKLELEALDQELEGYANTAIKKINREVELRSTTVQDFAGKLTSTLAKRLTRVYAIQFLKKLGGVGGTAAGAGNLVKMLVKRGGKLFGKTFSREVYTKIGRIFTKRTLQRLNIISTVLTEVIVFVWKAHRWQKKEKERLEQAIGQFNQEIIDDLLNNILPDIKKVNIDAINELYNPLLEEIEVSLKRRSQSKIQLQSLNHMRMELRKLKERIK